MRTYYKTLLGLIAALGAAGTTIEVISDNLDSVQWETLGVGSTLITLLAATGLGSLFGQDRAEAALYGDEGPPYADGGSDILVQDPEPEWVYGAPPTDPEPDWDEE